LRSTMNARRSPRTDAPCFRAGSNPPAKFVGHLLLSAKSETRRADGAIGADGARRGGGPCHRSAFAE
jgi:hypothetical protein